VTLGGKSQVLRLKPGGAPETFIVETEGKPVSITLLEASNQRVELLIDGERFSYQRPVAALTETAPTTPTAVQGDTVVAPMPGKVIGAMVKKGETVRAGDPLIIIESMKMETAVRSDRDGVVEEILVSDGISVKRGQALVRLAKAPS
jgi:biotin carboxyl carrier protein